MIKPGVRKVGSGAVGGAAVTILLYALEAFGHALAPGVAGALATLISLGVAYLTPEKYEVTGD